MAMDTAGYQPEMLTNQDIVEEPGTSSSVLCISETSQDSNDLDIQSNTVDDLPVNSEFIYSTDQDFAHSTPVGISHNSTFIDENTSEAMNNFQNSLKCPQCNKGIPERVFAIHQSMCSSNIPPTIEKSPEVKTIPNLSLTLFPRGGVSDTPPLTEMIIAS